jgi:hypothetical protein
LTRCCHKLKQAQHTTMNECELPASFVLMVLAMGMSTNALAKSSVGGRTTISCACTVTSLERRVVGRELRRLANEKCSNAESCQKIVRASRARLKSEHRSGPSRFTRRSTKRSGKGARVLCAQSQASKRHAAASPHAAWVARASGSLEQSAFLVGLGYHG